MNDLPTTARSLLHDAAESPGRTFLAARWLGVAMVNFEVDPRLLEPLVPRGVELDFFAGRTYVSLVGFLFQDTRVMGCCVPWHRHFPEVNLRYYVRRVVGGEVRRGVVFLRELVPRWAVATVARWLYNEPYVATAMRHQWQNIHSTPDGVRGNNPGVLYEWRLAGDWLGMEVEGHGSAQPLAAGSQEEFIAEHYWGYCRQRDGGTIEYRVEHPSWRVWADASARLIGPVVDYYGPSLAEVLRQKPASALVADGSAVKVSRPTRIA